MIADRCHQARVVAALEPEWEGKFEPRSYGFRPGRGCHDAIQAVYEVVKGKRPKRQWALDADLAQAFDRLGHDHILAMLGTFPARGMVAQWLMAGVVEQGRLHRTQTAFLLRTYQRDLLPQLSAYSARLVAISPETPDASLSTQEKAELTYTVLSDSGAQVAAAIGITFDPSDEGLAAQRTLGVDIRTTRADRGTTLPMPTVLIIDSDHIVRFVDIHPDYTGRTEVGDILAALQALPSS